MHFVFVSLFDDAEKIGLSGICVQTTTEHVNYACAAVPLYVGPGVGRAVPAAVCAALGARARVDEPAPGERARGLRAAPARATAATQHHGWASDTSILASDLVFVGVLRRLFLRRF